MSPDDPHQVLQGILADPEFQAWENKLSAGIEAAFRGLGRWEAGLPSIAQLILFSLCLGLLAALVARALSAYQGVLAPIDQAAEGPPDDRSEIGPSALAGRASALAAQGRLREATRSLQQAVYRSLAQSRRVAWNGAWADWEWVQRFAEEGPELASFTERSQAVAYGADSSTEFEELRAWARRWV